MKEPAAASWLARSSVLVLALASITPLSAVAQTTACGSLANAYGPYDYRTDRDKLAIVEQHHFAPQQESLIRGRGEGGASLGGNIDYTLRAFPNHHRALLAMERLGARLRLTKVPGAEHSVECYFVRALQFAPNDHIARLLFAKYLARHGRNAEGMQQINAAKGLAGDNPFAHYNVGIAYADFGDFEAALEQAHRAKAMGMERTELMERLKAANRWRDPAPSILEPVSSVPIAAPREAAASAQ